MLFGALAVSWADHEQGWSSSTRYEAMNIHHLFGIDMRLGHMHEENKKADVM